MHKNNCKMRRETFKLWDLVRLILEIWQQMHISFSTILVLRPTKYTWRTRLIPMPWLLVLSGHQQSDIGYLSSMRKDFNHHHHLECWEMVQNAITCHVPLTLCDLALHCYTASQNLVIINDCHLFGSKPLPEPMLIFLTGPLGTNFSENWINIS